MEDKTLMEDLLLVSKGLCDLYMHGTIESSTPYVLSTFHNSLNELLIMQSEIYQKMEQKGWYQTQMADTTEVKKAYLKFATQK